MLATNTALQTGVHHIPEILEKLSPVDIKEGTSKPKFALPVNPTLFKSYGDESTKAANPDNLTFVLSRQELEDSLDGLHLIRITNQRTMQ